MAELVVPPLVRTHLAARALSPDAGEVPHDQVRSITAANRRRLLGWRDHLFGTQLRGHLGTYWSDTALQQPRLSEIAWVCAYPSSSTHTRRSAPRETYCSAMITWRESEIGWLY